jgi:hypothetical protein
MTEEIQHDDLKNLMMQEGLLQVTPGFTDRVMQIVEETAKSRETAYQPLLSKKAWMLIAASAILLVSLSWIILSGSVSGPNWYDDVLKIFSGYFSGLDLSVHINTAALLISAMIIGSIGIFISLDIVFFRKFSEFNA